MMSQQEVSYSPHVCVFIGMCVCVRARVWMGEGWSSASFVTRPDLDAWE